MSATLPRTDQEMFALFGVGPALRAAAQVRHVTDAEARELYGMSFDGDLSGIVFPYVNPATGERVTARLRRDNPETGPDGKPQNKYICAYGDNRHLYFPPGAVRLLGDNTVPVVIVESEKAALAMTALAARSGRRMLAIATGGCWGWRGKIGFKTTAIGGREEERGPLSDLSIIAWEQERPAYVVFDSNTAANPRVRSARWAFAHTLVGLAAKVLFVDIPGEGGVNGPDDLIGTAGDEAMLKLLDTSRPFAEQAEKDAEEAVIQLSKSSPLEARDDTLDLIAAVSDVYHQRVLAARAAKALGERKDSLERDIGARARSVREARGQATALVRLGQLLRMKIEPEALIEELEGFFRKRLRLPKGAETILALFTMNTYVFDVFDTTPYLQTDSATGGCGKTTLLLHLKVTCCRAHLGGDPSEASLFRRIDRDRPTWLLDEAAVVRAHDPRAIAIRAILDAGYRKGATVSRCEGESNELRDFQVFCPKAFALVGSLRGTQLDRCIVMHMIKTKGLPKTKLKFIEREGTPLREKLEAYAAQYRNDLQALYDAEPEEGYWPDLSGREEELWGPLLTHAKLAGEQVAKHALEVALDFSRQKAEMSIAEDHDLALTQELKEALEGLASEKFSPTELVPLLAKTESWGEKLAACKSDQARVCVIGRFLDRFRLPSRERCREGTRYKRQEALEAVASHTPELNATNATQPVNTRVSEVATPPGGIATTANGDATQAQGPTEGALPAITEDGNATQPVNTRVSEAQNSPSGDATEDAVAIPPDPVAVRPKGIATYGSHINTASVACGNSSEGSRQGLLKF